MLAGLRASGHSTAKIAAAVISASTNQSVMVSNSLTAAATQHCRDSSQRIVIESGFCLRYITAESSKLPRDQAPRHKHRNQELDLIMLKSERARRRLSRSRPGCGRRCRAQPGAARRYRSYAYKDGSEV